ncbi:putative transcriptional regulator [Psychroflexus salarius]|uniref:Putative transcriptional regulator n=1 Tax=Psychroflexus salarius TaxID=1155689 RepID=A0A1M4T055_9FLAO|nr:YqgE/AlgH family protein [Psychroflexus salarius]SHE37813.1 putative transcriptional regulator [Psychroflexus salarius]
MKDDFPKQGEILISDPSLLGDDIFTRSVILINYIDEVDVVGFILNKAADMKLKEILPSIKNDYDIYIGGPVEQDSLYFIHTVPELIPNSVEVNHGIYWGGQFEAIEDLLNNNTITPQQIKFFVGYTGWKKNQLKQELSVKSWIINRPLNLGEIFSTDKLREFWKEKMRLIGGEYLIWSNAPDNPNYN